MTQRRQFDLLEEDEAFLNDYGLPWETINDGSQWVLIHNLKTHAGYNHQSVTAAIRLETGYPSAQLDMVYFHPALARLCLAWFTKARSARADAPCCCS